MGIQGEGRMENRYQRLLLAVIVLLLAAAVGVAGQAMAQTITEYPIPTANSIPFWHSDRGRTERCGSSNKMPTRWPRHDRWCDYRVHGSQGRYPGSLFHHHGTGRRAVVHREYQQQDRTHHYCRCIYRSTRPYAW